MKYAVLLLSFAIAMECSRLDDSDRIRYMETLANSLRKGFRPSGFQFVKKRVYTKVNFNHLVPLYLRASKIRSEAISLDMDAIVLNRGKLLLAPGDVLADCKKISFMYDMPTGETVIEDTMSCHKVVSKELILIRPEISLPMSDYVSAVRLPRNLLSLLSHNIAMIRGSDIQFKPTIQYDDNVNVLLLSIPCNATLTIGESLIVPLEKPYLIGAFDQFDEKRSRCIFLPVNLDILDLLPKYRSTCENFLLRLLPWAR